MSSCLADISWTLVFAPTVARLDAGVTHIQNATRAKANAFHFRRQVIIVQRAGGGSSQRQFTETCHSVWNFWRVTRKWVATTLRSMQFAFFVFHIPYYPISALPLAASGVVAIHWHCESLQDWQRGSRGGFSADDFDPSNDSRSVGRCGQETWDAKLFAAWGPV